MLFKSINLLAISSLLLLTCSFLSLAIDKPKLHCVADEWLGYTNADGSGTYWQIIKAIYSEQFQLRLETTPFHRAVKMVSMGKADCIIAIYAADKRNLLLPKYHIDTEYPASLLFDSKRTAITSTNDLNNLVIVGRKDYGFEEFLPSSVKYYGVESNKELYKLVLNNRADAVMVYTHNIALADPKNTLAHIEIIPDKKYYIGFYNSVLGQQLTIIYDLEFPKLIASGAISSYFIDKEKYQHANFFIHNND